MIGHLVILAAPGGGGKSELRKRLFSGQLRTIEARLGIQAVNQWHVVSRRKMEATDWPELAGDVIFECNIQSLYCNGLAYENDEKIAQIVRQAREISFVTLWTPPDRLLRQRVKRDLAKIRNSGLLVYGPRRAFSILVLYLVDRFDALSVVKSSGPRSRAWQRLVEYLARIFINRFWAFYLRPSEVVRCYGAWLQFCASFSPMTCRTTCIVEFDKTLKFHSREEWEDAVQIYL